MQDRFYPYDKMKGSRYTFTSIGRRRIGKQVIFTHTGVRNIFNMGFGDLMPDGSISDRANSNNGDMVSVLTTVVEILKDFTSRHPHVQVLFAGNTQERTRLYTRILKRYYSIFSKEFTIKCLIAEGDGYAQLPFEPRADLKYIGFLIQRI